jgi:Helix-turn-helix domain
MSVSSASASRAQEQSNTPKLTETEFRISRAACRLRMMNDKDLSDAAARLGYIILECADHNSPDPFPGVERLAELTGKDERTIKRLTKELVARGHLVLVEAGGNLKKKHNVYRMGLGQKCPPVSASKDTSRGTFSSKTGGHFCPETGCQKCPPKTYSKQGTPEDSNLKSECDASASPHAPADVCEVDAVSQDYAYRPTERSTVVQLRAMSVSVGRPEIGKPRSGTDSVQSTADATTTVVDATHRFPKAPNTKRPLSNGAAGTGNGSGGKRKPRGAGGTPIADDWWPRNDFEVVYARSKGYSDKSIRVMAEEFVAWYQSDGRKSASWFAMWKSWVLRELKLPNGHRPVKLDATGKPVEKPVRLDPSII